jgi:hypothetical protein
MASSIIEVASSALCAKGCAGGGGPASTAAADESLGAGDGLAGLAPDDDGDAVAPVDEVGAGTAAPASETVLE